MIAPRCPHCRGLVFLDWLECQHCSTQLGYHAASTLFFAVGEGPVDVDGETWWRCSNRNWGCNWLVADDSGSGECFSCRLTRREPAADDTIALEKLATTEATKRRLLVQLYALGLPVTAFWQREGGLGFDLLSSRDGDRVTIGHANGIITLDLAETLDAHRESLRVRLGEPYRTMLGHFRHEIGHYYQWQLVTADATLATCRSLFGDERASYRDAITRHYEFGAPEGWQASFISEYATMHPWEDFAETFAHYLHITGTLATAAAAGLRLDAEQSEGVLSADVVPAQDYTHLGIDRILEDWRWLSLLFNRINRAMGQNDLYPFTLSDPVRRKLAFVHGIVTNAQSA